MGYRFFCMLMNKEEIIFVVSLIALAVLMLTVPSCKTVQSGVQSTRDSVRVVERHDSIRVYERDSVFIQARRDTIIVQRERWHYKDRIVVQRDTVTVNKTDSITNTITTNKLNTAQKGMVAGFWVLLVGIILYIMARVGIWLYKRRA